MPRVTVSYNDYQFDTTGRPSIAHEITYEPPAADAPPERAVTVWTIKQEFAEHSFADNHARYGALLTALRTPEGLLTITDENGAVVFSERVRVVQGSLPEQWSQYILEVSVQFRAIRTDLLGDATNATYTPTGGAPVTLNNVRSYRDSIRTERPSTNTDYRRETMITIAVSGGWTANPDLDQAARMAALQARKTAIEAIRDCPNGTLVFGADSHLCRVDQVEVDIGAGNERLEWTLTASYRAYPDGTDVQAEYDVDEREGLEKAELLLTVSGTVKAKTRAAAESRAEQIKAQYASARVLLDASVKVALIDGEDAEDGWTALNFTFSYRQSLDVISWDLVISDRDDLKTANLLTSYTGKVAAQTSAAALAKARSLGDGKYPLRMTSTEAMTWKSVGDSADIFVECSFAYEYQRKGSKIYAEVSSETGNETFGVSSETISGFVVAATQAAAESTAATFKLEGRLLRTERVVKDNQRQVTDSVSQFVRVNFSYGYFLGKSGAGSISYTREDSRDYEARTRNITLAGTAWGADEAACDGLIDALITAERGLNLLRDVRTPSFEAAQTLSAFLAKNFNISFSGTLTAVAGEDILQAENTVSITYSADIAVLTNIPGAAPFVELAVYQSPASLSVSGQVTALTELSARTWARAVRSGTIGGWIEDPPREDMTFVFAKKSGTTVVLHRASFQYAGRKQTLFLT